MFRTLRRLLGRASLISPSSCRDDPLADREVARAEQHEPPIPGHVEDAHLAVGPDLIDTRVGAGIRRKNKTFVDGDGETIGHALRPVAGIGTPKIWPLSYTTPGVLRRRDPGGATRRAWHGGSLRRSMPAHGLSAAFAVDAAYKGFGVSAFMLFEAQRLR
jgi:hypothetical protein